MDVLHFWDCHAKAKKNLRFASLTSGSENLLKYVTYVTSDVSQDSGSKVLCFHDNVQYWNRRSMFLNY